MKKLMSLLLVLCTVLTSLPFFVLPAAAAEAKATVYSTSFASNVPTLSNGTVTFRNNWSAFAFGKNQYNVGGVAMLDEELTAFSVPGGIIAEKLRDTVWAACAHMSTQTQTGNYFKNAGQLNVTPWQGAGIRYTAEYTGTMDIIFDKLGNYGSLSADKDCFRYAIFHNGEMVWPVKGGSLDAISSLSAKTMTNVSAVTDLVVAKGDIIDFVCQGVGLPETGDDWAGYGNVMYPTVKYTETREIDTSLGLLLGDSLTVCGTLKIGATDVTRAGIAFDGVDTDAELQSDGTYRVIGPKYNAKNVVDELTVRAYYYQGNTRVDAPETKTSVAALLYAYSQTEDKNGMQYAEIAAATLGYAAAAQNYFNYKTDALATGGLTVDADVKGTYDPDKLFVVTKLVGATVAPSEMALLLRDTVGIHVKVAPLGDAVVDMTGYALQVADNATFDSASNIAIEDGKAEMLGISARLWNDSFYFRIVDADGTPVSSTFTYGISAYYARMNENDEVADLVKSMMRLYEATKAKLNGTTMDASADAMTPNDRTGTAVSITAANLVNAIKNGTLEAGKVYTVSNASAMTVDMSDLAEVNGNGAVIVTTKNIVFKNATNATIKNLTIVTDAGVQLKTSTGLSLENVEIISATGLNNYEACVGTALRDCRIIGTGSTSALINAAPTFTLYRSYVQSAAAGVAAISDTSTGDGLYEDSVIYANGGAALSASGSEITVRYCTLRGSIAFADGENYLVGGCFFKGAGDSVTLTSTHNSAIVLNDLTNISVISSSSPYIVDNNVYGKLTLDYCKYALANGNNLYAGAPDMVSCTEYSGDNLRNVTLLTGVGVNEDLLPKVDEDVHINMERKTTVRVPYGTAVDIAEYINSKTESGKSLIVSPGAYLVRLGEFQRNNKIVLDGIENANIYAYGVLYERQSYQGTSLAISNSKNVAIYGLTMNMTVQSSGYVIVTQKLSNNQVQVVKGAGVNSMSIDNTGAAVSNYYWNGDHLSLYRKNSSYSYTDGGNSNKGATFDANGFATFSFGEAMYNEIQVGDILTCRQADSLTYFYRCADLLFEDVTIYGGSVRCFWDDYCETGTTLNRVIDKPMPAKVITEAEYNTYKGYESTYGIYTGVYIDEYGNYRGTPSRTATADFAHSAASKTGFTATNCIVSGLSDDGTNNQGFKDRVAGYDAATGTLTIANDNGWGEGWPSTGLDGKPEPLYVGERVMIYTSTGKLIAKTTVLSCGDIYNNNGYYMQVKIPVDAIPEGAFNGFDLSNAYGDAHKILIQSLDRMGEGVYFENVLFENIRSRGALIKSDNVTIKNCSFYNIGMGAIAMNFETWYGESGFVNNVLIKNNYIENTGYFSNWGYYSPISVDSPSVQGTDAYLRSSHVTIEGNVIRNRGTTYAIYLRGVRNVIVRNNDFGKIKNTTAGIDVFGIYVNHVELAGNTYSTGKASTATAFSGHRDVTGADVTLENDRGVMAALSDAFEESRFYLDANGDLHFTGNWDAGYYGRSSNPSSFVAYGGAENSDPDWYAYIAASKNGDPWSGYGGLGNICRDFRYIPTYSYNSAIRYTVPYDSEASLSLSTFFPSYDARAGVTYNDGYFAIYHNNTKVWPTNSSWYTITKDTSHAELNASIAQITLNVKAGDKIYFVARQISSGKQPTFSAVPVVHLLTADIPYVPTGNQTKPDSIWDIFR